MTENLSILGSTGSIGKQSLDVCRKCGYGVKALTAFSSVEEIEKQAREFKPEKVALVDEKAAADLKIKLADTDIKVLGGMDGVCECAEIQSADTVLNSVVGMAGLKPTLTAIYAGKKIALANKETLVAGGQLVMSEAKKHGVEILPVDSEHSAIFQCLQGKPTNKALKKIILTASGGPFFGKTADELRDVTVEKALKHPNWSMGAKITIDSATMMNKGLELIEAVWLFSVKPDDVDIVVHRESIVHSAVEYDDNSVIAQLGLPDMRIPIQYALTYPERFESPVGELSLSQIGKLTFFEPDYETFRCINLCRKAINMGGLYPAAVNSANEQANLMFRQGKIGFLDIADRVEAVLEKTPHYDNYTFEDILEIDKFAREIGG
ncbi:MAG: 1-deoxy-D-xylulose-5-phosphate reductoisomerase [Ruminococcus sp.]|nr:1-deoxy-D-xylulose-5-phosphate reductoisomerase [Ruminococcus sp.]MDY4908720.1 1-deoxy-D-xylulose-5-phosphate reductoisomerase [Candidatus Fimenecus sp.]